jgi:hypothetical protein
MQKRMAVRGKDLIGILGTSIVYLFILTTTYGFTEFC